MLFKLRKYFSLIHIKSNIHLFYFLQHETIHTYVQAFNASYITDRIEIGSIYKIGNFYVEPNKLLIIMQESSSLAVLCLYQSQKMFLTLPSINFGLLTSIKCNQELPQMKFLLIIFKTLNVFLIQVKFCLFY